MPTGKRLLLFSPADPHATDMTTSTSDWGCLVTACESIEEFRGRLEGSDYDMVMVEEATTLRNLVSEGDPSGDLLRTPLAEVEKRHILRVLSSTGGNKTRAARILGIDTKTLYNKLKSYGAAAAAYRRPANGQLNSNSSRSGSGNGSGNGRQV